MAKTRMMTQKGECYLCGKIGQTEEHHCFGGPNRKFSEKYGLKVYLCISCHREGPQAIHGGKDGSENRKILHEDAQRANPVANADLWQKVAEAAKIHKITIFLI